MSKTDKLPQRSWSTITHLRHRIQVPSSVEHQLPDSVHDTGSNKETGKVSHATGDSKVPKALQEGLPASVEKIVPNSVSVAMTSD